MNRLVCFVFTLILNSVVWSSEPLVLFEGKDSFAPKQPQACIDSNGTAHVAFGVGNDVYHCTVRDDKTSTPKVAFQIPNMSLGLRRGPRIARSNSSVVITAIGGLEGKGKDGDILCFRSMDEGKTWIGPNRVNDVEGSAREGLHAMTASDDGTLWCVWLDLRDRGTKLFVSKSIDQGATWTKNVLAYRSPSGSICECCHPSILAQGSWVHILFRNSLKGDRDMYLASSNDHGETFGQAIRIGDKNWALNACPMDGGMLAVDHRGQMLTTYRRSQNVFIAGNSTQTESILGTGEQPWIAGTDEGFFTVWTSKRDGDLMLLRPKTTEPEKLSDSSSFPVVISGTQSKPPTYVLWEKRDGNRIAILGQRIQ